MQYSGTLRSTCLPCFPGASANSYAFISDFWTPAKVKVEWPHPPIISHAESLGDAPPYRTSAESSHSATNEGFTLCCIFRQAFGKPATSNDSHRTELREARFAAIIFLMAPYLRHRLADLLSVLLTDVWQSLKQTDESLFTLQSQKARDKVKKTSYSHCAIPSVHSRPPVCLRDQSSYASSHCLSTILI
jgi:hypothetical protein